MNRNAASTIPISIATTRSIRTVIMNVTRRTMISLFGALKRAVNSRHSLILYATTISTAASDARGTILASGIKRSIMRRSVIA